MLGFSHPSMQELYDYIFPNAPLLIIAYAVLWLALSAYIVFLIIRMISVDDKVQELQDSVDAKLGKAKNSG